MKAIKLENGRIRTYENELPKKWRPLGIIGLRTKTEEELFEIGFREVIFPSKTDTQKYDEISNIDDSWYNDLDDKYYVPLLDIPQDEIDEENTKKIKKDKIKLIAENNVILEEGVTKDGKDFVVVVDNNLKLEVIEII